jgi:cold shock CspA family protein
MMATGTISRWFEAQGFGFITPSNAGPGHKISDDVFVHRSAIPRGMEFLPVGTRVIYDIRIDERTGRRKAQPCHPLAEASECGPLACDHACLSP